MASSRRKRSTAGESPAGNPKRRAMGEGVASAPPSVADSTRKSSRLASRDSKAAAVDESGKITLTSYKEDHKKVPLHVKELYGQIGFVKWTNSYCPILIINPCQAVQQDNLPMGIYHAWMTALENALLAQTNKKLEPKQHSNIPLLVYWYGTYYEYSVVSPRHIIRYDDAVREGYDVIPDFVKYRRDHQLQLPYAYELNFLALPMVSSDLDKLPRDRRVVLPSISSNTTSTITSRQQRRKNKLSAELETVSSSVVLNEWHTLALTEEEGSQYSSEIAVMRRFEVKRKKILQCICPMVKATFGTIGFSSDSKQTTSANRKRSRKQTSGASSKTLHPVLILSPFRCPPGPIRSEWFDRYHKWVTTSPNCKETIPCLVYWYGAYTCGQSCARPFSFVPFSRVISYEDGVKKGHDKLLPEILSRYYQKDSKKCKKGGTSRLSVLQDWLVCGHWEVKLALHISPSNRWGGMQDFEEDYDDDFEFYRDCVGEGEALTSTEMCYPEDTEASCEDVEVAPGSDKESVAEDIGDNGPATSITEAPGLEHQPRDRIQENCEHETGSHDHANVGDLERSDCNSDDTDSGSDSDSAMTVVVLDDSASCASSESSVLTPLPGENDFDGTGVHTRVVQPKLLMPPLGLTKTNSFPLTEISGSTEYHSDDHLFRKELNSVGPCDKQYSHDSGHTAKHHVVVDETLEAVESEAQLPGVARKESPTKVVKRGNLESSGTPENHGNSLSSFMASTAAAWTKENTNVSLSSSLHMEAVGRMAQKAHPIENFTGVLGLKPNINEFDSLPDSQHSKLWSVSFAVLPSKATSESENTASVSTASKESATPETEAAVSCILSSSPMDR